jgi:hypothetical protein
MNTAKKKTGKEAEMSQAGTSERRNGDTPLGYSRQAALRREQHNVNTHCQARAP